MNTSETMSLSDAVVSSERDDAPLSNLHDCAIAVLFLFALHVHVCILYLWSVELHVYIQLHVHVYNYVSYT